MGCDLLQRFLYKRLRIFQSTQPEWAATIDEANKALSEVRFQSTQPEWAATFDGDVGGLPSIISIHAARVGCDICLYYALVFVLRFQSTQPEWAATIF